MKARLTNVFSKWIPYAILLITISGIIYITGQQNYRQNANDPQIQYAQDIASALDGGQTADNIIGTSQVNMETSLAIFAVIFDENSSPAASSVQLQGQTPIPPQGVFAYTKDHSQNRFTWEPQKGLRVAAVMQMTDDKNRYVLVARSLNEIEIRIKSFEIIVLSGTGIGLILIFIAIFLTIDKNAPSKRKDITSLQEMTKPEK